MDEEYWNSRYTGHNTPWDIGHASPPLTAFLQGMNNRQQQMLLPGAGNAHEADWLHNNGFENLHVLDIARQPLQNLKSRLPDFPEAHLHHQDFFEHQGQYDLIIEQTFFCALPPALRDNYVRKMHHLLKPGGQLFGVLFDFPLSEKGPPFGGSREEYRQRFGRYFKIHKLESCYNSIKPRMGNEVFFRMVK